MPWGHAVGVAVPSPVRAGPLSRKVARTLGDTLRPQPMRRKAAGADLDTDSGSHPVGQPPLQHSLSQTLYGQQLYSSARRRSLLNRSVTENMATANPSWTNINP